MPLAIALCLLFLQATSPKPLPAPVTTIVLVRHAEAMTGAGSDPVLTAAGIARSSALASALEHAQVTAIMTTQYKRTMMTGQQLAERVNVPLLTIPVQGPTEGHVIEIVQNVHANHAGRTVVIIGHSNTVPALVKGLSGVDVGEIAHDSYDNMFIVTMTGPGAGTVVRARYGAR